MIASRLLFALLVAWLPPHACGQDLAPQSVAGEKLIASAREALDQKASVAEGTLEVVPVGVLAPSRLSEGSYELRAGEIRGEWPRRRVGVPVQVWQNGVMLHSRMVWFSVRWWKEALAYARPATSGDPASAESVHRIRMDVTGIESLPGNDVSWMEGMRFRRAVRVGQPVLKSDFESVPVVGRDQEVQVSVQIGLVHLVTKGLASQEGAMDEVIDVRPEGSQRSVRARIVAKNEVQIER